MWFIEREIELKYNMLWFENGLGQKSDENDGFCPFYILRPMFDAESEHLGKHGIIQSTVIRYLFFVESFAMFIVGFYTTFIS